MKSDLIHWTVDMLRSFRACETGLTRLLLGGWMSGKGVDLGGGGVGLPEVL